VAIDPLHAIACDVLFGIFEVASTIYVARYDIQEWVLCVLTYAMMARSHLERHP